MKLNKFTSNNPERVVTIIRIDCMNISKILAKVVSEEMLSRMCDCIIMSGGIDTSYIATIARKILNQSLRGVIVGLEGTVARDMFWGSAVARALGIEVIHRVYSIDDALRATDFVVDIMDTFDPVEVRNDVSVYIALEEASRMGCRCVYTGDAGDELFAGYPYMHLYRLDELGKYIEDLSSYMEFSSIEIGRKLGIEVFPPLASRRVIEIAIEIPPECKVSYQSTARGKEILRTFLEDLSIPSSRRAKDPIESGSGSIYLSTIWSSLATDDLVEKVSKVIKPRSRDQAYLISRYLNIKGEPKRATSNSVCKICGGRMKRGYCKRCGYYEGKIL